MIWIMSGKDIKTEIEAYNMDEAFVVARRKYGNVIVSAQVKDEKGVKENAEKKKKASGRGK